jgi:hypothetical protein
MGTVCNTKKKEEKCMDLKRTAWEGVNDGEFVLSFNVGIEPEIFLIIYQYADHLTTVGSPILIPAFTNHFTIKKESTKKHVSIMKTSHLKTGVESTSETSPSFM